MSLYNITHKIGERVKLRNGSTLAINAIKINESGIFYYNTANNRLYKDSDFAVESNHDRSIPVHNSPRTAGKTGRKSSKSQSKSTSPSTADDRPSDTDVLRGDQQQEFQSEEEIQ